ncbi:MAG TPA: hypothetical protein VN033_05725 [Vulgatibacter sp.]|nr:hypothetical protein [Vulgatibacter sp.]
MSTSNPAATMAPGAHVEHDQTLKVRQVRWEAARAKTVATISFAVGVVGIVATLIGTRSDPTQVFGSYLFAYLLFLTLALGSLFFVLLHHITAARWGVTMRRIAEAVMSTLPMFAILFVPLVFGLTHLFEWMDPEVVATDELIQEKSGYLNTTFFGIRAVFYFLVWSGLAVYLGRMSVRQDAGDGAAILAKLKTASAPGMALFGITITFAAFDWVMSLSPHWFSTIFGVYVFSGAIQGALALLIVLAMLLQRGGMLQGVVTIEHYHDLGKLLFGFTVFFAYIGFSQYFLIWYANIPEETFWYLARWEHGWAPLSLGVVFFGFAIPFLWLLTRHAKRNLGPLLVGALVVLVGRIFDVYWLVMPSLDHHQHGPQISWFTFTAILGIGGMFVGLLALRLAKHPLIPVGDPHLRSSLDFENA